MMSIIICIFFTLKDWILCSVNLGSVGFQDSNELLNSVTDKHENKNPYTELNTCTMNDFLFTVLT